MKKVELLDPGLPTGIGARRRLTWRTALPYTLSFDICTTEIEPEKRLLSIAEGELVGTGLWQLTATSKGTLVRYDWKVETTKAWMNVLAPIARPLFGWNHAKVMAEGGRALAKLLATPVSK